MFIPKKLLDQIRQKLRAGHYALATEKSYRHWIVEFLRFHRATFPAEGVQNS